MRRNYMSPEYSNNLVYGTLNMIEESNFFSSRMLEIEEEIIIDNIDMIWYQNSEKEQLDISLESTFAPYIYSTSQDKKDNVSLTIDESQTPIGINIRNIKWIFEIKIKEILTNYLFANLKKHRTFEGVKNAYTIYDDVDEAIIQYIKNNVLNRYKFKKIDLFISYINIGESEKLKYSNNWNSNLSSESLTKSYQSFLNSDESVIKLTFSQPNSNNYIFDYYYNIQFDRI